MRMLLCVLGAALGAVVEAAQSPLKVAHCRAHCIQQLSRGSGGRDCPDTANCGTCWEQCESRASAGGSRNPDTTCTSCGVGCRLACHFYQQLAVQRPPVSVTKGRGVIILSGDSAVWPPPADTSGPHVFVLMCRRGDNSWVQVTQTLQLGWTIPSPEECGAVRVMVVGPLGLVTVYSPAPGPLQDAGIILQSVGKDLWNTPLMDSRKIRQDGRWSLREISLIHQGVLVIAEVSWEPQVSTVYMVTWELAGGGLKGHLLTDTTTVTLSLWPDAVYRIQVQEVEDPERESEALILDTRLATPLPSPDDTVTAGHPGFESVAAALLLFLALALALTSRRLSSHHPTKEIDGSDHFKLFPPPVRLLVPDPPSA